MRLIVAPIAIHLLVGCFGSAGYAQANREQYELQERCGRLASDVFHKEYREAINTKEAQTRFTYRNHYSPSLNKCFFLEMSYGFHNAPIYTDKMYRLYDVNENSQYGVFYRRSDMTAPMACQVGDKICWSEDEWETLISFYMGDRQDVNVP